MDAEDIYLKELLEKRKKGVKDDMDDGKELFLQKQLENTVLYDEPDDAEELFLEQLLRKELNVVATNIDDTKEHYVIDVDSEAPSESLLDIQDLLLEKVPEGKTKSITIGDGETEIAHIDMSPLAAFKSDIEKLQHKLERLSEVEETLDKINTLTDTYKNTQRSYEEKLEKVESMINHKFGLVDNTINKQKGIESDIKPSSFKEINKKYGAEIKDYFKNTYKKLFQGKGEKGAAEQQSMNNALYAKLKLKENLLKEFKNTRSTANPDQIAEELLLSLIRPIKAVGNSLHQYSAEKKELSKNQNKLNNTSQTITEAPKAFAVKPEISIKLNGNEFAFQGYSKDYSKVLLKDAMGTPLEKANNENISLNFKSAPKLNPIQQDLLKKGKTLLMTDGKFPYKLSKGENDYLNITTVSISEFTAGKKESQKNSKSIKRSI
ncbi:hypothetical protein [Maribacter sp.]|uniref:hypothetical protein n=1 Tax=Maribacter sp. TaxID=1897614 RepID=UPI0025C5F535|nr:hypothetical protein [Maribacter sp.]|tara:strand:+ start:1116 stop:2420 length:1305 start_codon:yes stop_codon:yes gene_type:complete